MASRTRASILALVVSLVPCGAALRAWAAVGGVPPLESVRHRHACRFDIRRFCADVERGRPTTECLLRHEAELTDGCRRALAERGPRR